MRRSNDLLSLFYCTTSTPALTFQEEKTVYIVWVALPPDNMTHKTKCDTHVDVKAVFIFTCSTHASDAMIFTRQGSNP